MNVAIDIQRRAYRLLEWLMKNVTSELAPLRREHGVLDDPAITSQWLARIHRHLPPEAAPPDGADADWHNAFSQYFTSYLMVSFVWVAPRASAAHVCPCPPCQMLRRPFHLHPRRLTAAEKRRATEDCIDLLIRLGEQYRRQLDAATARELLTDPEIRRDAALVAYAEDLLARIRGLSAHPSSLALWRRVAYTPTGAPRREFALTTEAVLAAKRSLVARLR